MLHPGHFLQHIMYGVIYSLEALTLVEMLFMELFSHGNSSLALHGRVWVLLALYGGQRLQTVQVLLMEMKTGTFVVWGVRSVPYAEPKDAFVRESQTSVQQMLSPEFSRWCGCEKEERICSDSMGPRGEPEALLSQLLALPESLEKLCLFELVLLPEKGLWSHPPPPGRKAALRAAFSAPPLLPKILFAFEFPVCSMKLHLCTDSGMEMCLFPQKWCLRSWTEMEFWAENYKTRL